ncbi:terminase small subunit [Leptospira stimsonii]|nr:terminase small subunit [Leptospira stimsonii]
MSESSPKKRRTRKKPEEIPGNPGRETAIVPEIDSVGDDGKGEDLTPMRKLFVENLVFVHQLNQTRAYMETYGTQNVNSANACASRLLGIASVREYRNKLLGEVLEVRKAELESIFVTVNREIALAEVADYIDESGEVSLDRMKSINPRAVKEISTTILYTKAGDEIVTRKFKLEGKQRSLEMIRRYLRLGETDEGKGREVSEGVIVYIPDDGRDSK